MRYHPYRDLPAYTRWTRGVEQVAPSELNPVTNFPFRIDKASRVSTAGSCFAQHIARHLSASGYNYFVTEPGHPIGSPEDRAAFGYGLFSARYGNIYTARQLLQLFDRAFGTFWPIEDHWKDGDRYFDPLRPTVEPNGYSSLEELRRDREQHLAAVRTMFEEADYFVFTLGLTEAWIDSRDGTALPVCPGVAAGTFEPTIHVFHNFSLSEILSDFMLFLQKVRDRNPKLKVILTVSPVPLAATAEDQHVLVATTYSKSVLRVAAEELARQDVATAYFPSYEIITGNYNRGAYYEGNLREINATGVAHVMRVFALAATDGTSDASSDLTTASQRQVDAGSEATSKDDFIERMRTVAQVACDEQLIEMSIASAETRS